MTSAKKRNNMDRISRQHLHRQGAFNSHSRSIKQPRHTRPPKRQCRHGSANGKEEEDDADGRDGTRDTPQGGVGSSDEHSAEGTTHASPPQPRVVVCDLGTDENSSDHANERPRVDASDVNSDASASDSDAEEPTVPAERTFTVIPQPIETLQDLIDVGMLFEEPEYTRKKYSVNIAGLYRMIPALQEFQQMVGMEALKKQVVDQVIYLSGKSNHQQFSMKSACTRDENDPPRPTRSAERSLLETLITGMSEPKISSKRFRMTDNVTDEDNNFDMFHTVVYGPPGVGKTAFAKVLARIFLSLGVTQTDTFRIARRSDLIGEYVGHTATKTQKVIDESMGGVLFIDEIYSLGNGGTKGETKTDSFSTECINTLNQNLTEHKGKFICIIAGYKQETEKHFFGLNPGLRRRFSFYYTINGYDWEELTKILLFKIDKLRHWSAEEDLRAALLKKAFLRDKTEHFKHYAGDIETLLLNTKIAHCKRVFGKHETLQRVITYQDVVDGFTRFVTQKGEDAEREKAELRMIEHLYT